MTPNERRLLVAMGKAVLVILGDHLGTETRTNAEFIELRLTLISAMEGK